MPGTVEHHPVICPLCEGRCGLLARVEDGRLAAFEGDTQDQVSRGFVCDTAQASVGALAHRERLRTPLRRGPDGTLVPATWDEALADIGSRMRQVRGRHGPASLGLYLGQGVLRSSRDLARSLAVGVGLGTPHLLSDQSSGAGPRLLVSEWMLGQPTPLLPDVGRAHYVLLLGDDPTRGDWGPAVGGTSQAAALRHSRKTKSTKLVVASPERGPLAQEADQHLAIRPGTEGWLLLGLLSAAIRGGWTDAQYIRDYCQGMDELTAALAPFPVERCAAACGIDPALLLGVALKLSRAAMAVIHAGHGAFSGPMASVSAWAWLALHSVTANTLRPGGLYAHPGVVDLQLALQAVPSEGGPRTRVGNLPLILLQAPGTALGDEALTPGDGQLRALICVDGDPLLDQPGAGRTRTALQGLDLLVCLSRWASPATESADWVLPLSHPWEREEVQLLDNVLLPVDQVGRSPAVVAAPEGVRTADEVLRALFSAIHPGPRGSIHSLRTTLGARLLAGAGLSVWEDRLLDWVGGVDRSALEQPPYRYVRGETNRAQWRVGHADGRIHLMPPQIEALLGRMEPPREDPAWPLFLRTSARHGRAPDPLHAAPAKGPPVAWLHPDTGIADGATVQVQTAQGSVQAVARHDASLRPDTVDLPGGHHVAVMELLPAEGHDPLCGGPWLDGHPCRVRVG